MAHVCASRAPEWFVRWSPPLVGVAVALASPSLRRTIAEQQERARGPVGAVRSAVDVACTFANFASCLAEVLSVGSKDVRAPEAIYEEKQHLDNALAGQAGIIFATAHTAGWDVTGPLFANDNDLRMMVVMQRERDADALALTDSTREAQGGLRIVHVGSDPLAPLPLLKQLRDGGVVAMQIDRVPAGMSSRAVTLFGRPGAIPEGPLRLAQLTGAPIVPVFSARTGYRRYTVHVRDPVTIARRADDRAIGAAAQYVADCFGDFVSSHPTQWFPFHA